MFGSGRSLAFRAVEGALAELKPRSARGAAAPLAAPTSPLTVQPANAFAHPSTPVSTPVTLDRSVETVRLALRASAANGVTHARISLSPQELGGIEIHLRHTADGLVARVVADSGQAAQLLQQSGGELRKSLEQQGLTLLSLDIGASGEQQAGAAGSQQGFGQQSGLGPGGPAGSATLAVETDAPAQPATRLPLPNGALVDVLA